MIKLLVGLGNPGNEYEDTRHNAGFWWIDAVARELKVSLVPERSYHGLMARTTVNGQTVWLLEPQTYMNDSGKAVSPARGELGVDLDHVIVVHDEIDLPGEIGQRIMPARARNPDLDIARAAARQPLVQRREPQE